MQKKRLAAVFTVILLLMLPVFAAGAGDSPEEEPRVEIIEEQMDAGGVNGIGNSIRQYTSEDSDEIFSDFDPESILRGISTGKQSFSLKGLLNSIVRYIFSEVYLNISLLIKLIILAVLCAVLRNLQASFLSESVGEMAFYACYIVMVTIMIISFNSVVHMGVDIIDRMVGFMQATIPVLITLLVSGGNITAAAVFQPVLISIVGISATIIKTVFIPLIFLSTILSVVDNISEKVQISKFAGLLKQISAWALGLLMTIFIAVVSVQGSLGAVVDGVTSKATKFAIGAFIPVAGKYLADAADTVIGCTLLIKNAGGVLVMIGVIMICTVPLLKMFALIAVYRLTCVLVEPISENRITKCINDMAGSLTFILGIVASVAVMFLISLAVIISASNISAMIR